jgi:hypothetical protein
MSLFLHKDCGQVPVVNGEEEASPPSYPYGRTSGLRVRGTPGSCLDLLAAPLSPKCGSPDTGQNARHHLEQAVLDQ